MAKTIPPLRRAIQVLVWAGAALVLPAAQVKAFDAGTVNGLCLAGFNAAMAAAGKTAPPGMAEFTCTCFSNRLKQGQSIDQARTECRQQAASRFTVQ
jgi:hypothetical protein